MFSSLNCIKCIFFKRVKQLTAECIGKWKIYYLGMAYIIAVPIQNLYLFYEER